MDLNVTDPSLQGHVAIFDLLYCHYRRCHGEKSGETLVDWCVNEKVWESPVIKYYDIITTLISNKILN